MCVCVSDLVCEGGSGCCAHVVVQEVVNVLPSVFHRSQSRSKCAQPAFGAERT